MSAQLSERTLPQEATSASYQWRLVHSQLAVNNAVFCQDIFCMIISLCALDAGVYVNGSVHLALRWCVFLPVCWTGRRFSA